MKISLKAFLTASSDERIAVAKKAAEDGDKLWWLIGWIALCEVPMARNDKTGEVTKKLQQFSASIGLGFSTVERYRSIVNFYADEAGNPPAGGHSMGALRALMGRASGSQDRALTFLAEINASPAPRSVRWTEETLIAAWDAKHPSKGPAKRTQSLLTRHRRIKRGLGAVQRVVRDEEYPLTAKARADAVGHINALHKLLKEVEAKHPEWKTTTEDTDDLDAALHAEAVKEKKRVRAK
jgi:hypothetical protein